MKLKNKLFIILLASMLLACGITTEKTTPTPRVTPTVFSAVTPTAIYGYYVGLWGYPMVTTEKIGDIPAGSRVRLSTSFYENGSTMYSVVMQDELTFADARQDQLKFISDVIPYAPIPPAVYASYIGMGQLFVTTEQVGEIVAGTRVGIGEGRQYYNEYRYVIYTQDGILSAEVSEDQITFAPDVTPGPTPTHSL